MAATPKIFQQLKPTDLVNSTLLYTVPAGISAQITIFVCNQSALGDYFRIGLVPSGGTLSLARYIAYDTPLTNNGVFAVAGIGLGAGDSVWIKSTLGGLSFTATGMEFTA